MGGGSRPGLLYAIMDWCDPAQFYIHVRELLAKMKKALAVLTIAFAISPLSALAYSLDSPTYYVGQDIVVSDCIPGARTYMYGNPGFENLWDCGDGSPVSVFAEIGEDLYTYQAILGAHYFVEAIAGQCNGNDFDQVDYNYLLANCPGDFLSVQWTAIATPSGNIAIPISLGADIGSNVGDQLADTGTLAFLGVILGIPLAFYVFHRLIALIPKGRDRTIERAERTIARTEELLK